jgi:hypothetical protein
LIHVPWLKGSRGKEFIEPFCVCSVDVLAEDVEGEKKLCILTLGVGISFSSYTSINTSLEDLLSTEELRPSSLEKLTSELPFDGSKFFNK